MTDSPFGSLLRTDLASFIAKTFQTVDPSTPYLHNWHIDVLAEHLHAVQKRDITRLIINMPPRYLKSICVNVAFPAWALGHNPAERIISASYSHSLSVKHALDSRLVINSPWYRNLFPNFHLSNDQNDKTKFITTERGFRFTTSVGGTITGEGGNILILDDPHNPAHINSDTVRHSTLEWFDQTFSTRLNNKKTGAIILVMQRLHPMDLSGYLLNKKPCNWEHLVLPAIAEKKTCHLIQGAYFTRRKNSLLHPEREGKKELEQTKQELGSHVFAAQYQQSPLATSGKLIKADWLQRFTTQPTGTIIQSWDTAIKSGKQHDYSVCTTWAHTHNAYYLLDITRAKMDFPALKRRLINLAEKWQPASILIEDKASGQSLIQELKQKTSLPILPRQATSSKLSRFMDIAPLIESGRVYLPEHAPWLSDFEMELLQFPDTSHDDQVDSFTQFLQWAKKKSQETMQIRML